MIVDGSYMLHRALRIPENFSAENGGVQQFFKSLKYELKRNLGYFPITVWDCGLSRRRLELYPNYKQGDHRGAFTGDEIDNYLEVYGNQRDMAINILKVFGIPAIRISDWEGDDIIYLVSRITDDVVLVSDDKDFYQLVSTNLKVSRPLAGEVVTEKNLAEKDLTPELCLVSKCIMGDRSDNIPNVARGLGKVNAERLARIIIDNPDTYLGIIGESNKKVDQEFVKNHETYLLNKKLIDLSELDTEKKDDILDIVLNEISSVMGKVNYIDAVTCFAENNIKEVDADTIITNVSFPQKHYL